MSKPIEVDIETIRIRDISNARKIILQHGVGVYILDNISKEMRDTVVNKTKFYENASIAGFV